MDIKISVLWRTLNKSSDRKTVTCTSWESQGDLFSCVTMRTDILGKFHAKVHHYMRNSKEYYARVPVIGINLLLLLSTGTSPMF